MAIHRFPAHVKWTGNQGSGTSGYTAFSRDHEISAEGKPVIVGSSAPAYRGDAARYNPEDLLVASIASCHMLWVLHLCAEAGVIVEEYDDDPVGEMTATGADGRFTGVTLHPILKVRAGADAAAVEAIHGKAHKLCFIANSVNFPVKCEPRMEII